MIGLKGVLPSQGGEREEVFFNTISSKRYSASSTCTFPLGSSSTQAPSLLLPCPCSFKCSAGCYRRRRPCCLLSTQSLLPFLLSPLQVQSPPPPFIPADCKRGFSPLDEKKKQAVGHGWVPLVRSSKTEGKMNALLCVSAL